MKATRRLAGALFLAALIAFPGAPQFQNASAAETVAGQWSQEKAQQWYRDQPWLVGCNFLPSTAVNDIEMWQAETFDPATIDRELGWAGQLGINTVRVFVNFVVWKDDPDGLKSRFREFLEIADRHQISVMPILFDDCNFAGRVAQAGKQPDPIPGVHNSQWVSSPPLSMITDRDAWPALTRYTNDLVGSFGRDPRIVIWDLYNEPGNSNMGEKSLPLVEAVFSWAREADPQQPLTIAPWADLNSRMSRRMFELSDVVSFHGYDKLEGARRKLAVCRQYERPVLCTEWLHRQSGNTVEAMLPFFKAERVGCYNWGLVSGRTQTYMPWGSQPGDPVPTLWQHDLLYPDGKPFRPAELQLFRSLTGERSREYESAGAQPPPRVARAAPADGMIRIPETVLRDKIRGGLLGQIIGNLNAQLHRNHRRRRAGPDNTAVYHHDRHGLRRRRYRPPAGRRRRGLGPAEPDPKHRARRPALASGTSPRLAPNTPPAARQIHAGRRRDA